MNFYNKTHLLNEEIIEMEITANSTKIEPIKIFAGNTKSFNSIANRKKTISKKADRPKYDR
ncbi:MAG: hypothetical protein ABIL58_11495 [Pseudomonadota bacterium]